MDLILVMIIVLVVGAAVAHEVSSDFASFAKWKADRQRCPHGIKGGLVLQRCAKCLAEKRDNERHAELLAEAETKRKRIRIDAANLRQTEAARLKKVIRLTLAELQGLSPGRFEDEMASMFKRLGYIVQQTPRINDMGRDAILQKDGEKFLLECKRYGDKSKVGRPDIQKFHSAIISDRAKSGFFVTTNKFTKEAAEHAAKLGITVIDGTELSRYLAKSNPSLPENEQYHSMCTACGEPVVHELRSPRSVVCKNGHPVEATLTFDYLFGDAASRPPPVCARCGAPMKLIKGKKRKKGRRRDFWGCSNYWSTRCTYKEQVREKVNL